jgi:hypothetical protein
MAREVAGGDFATDFGWGLVWESAKAENKQETVAAQPTKRMQAHRVRITIYSPISTRRNSRGSLTKWSARAARRCEGSAWDRLD